MLRLTNRGRLVAGIAATVVVLAGRHLLDGGGAVAQPSRPAAAGSPAPIRSSATAASTPRATPTSAGPTSRTQSAAPRPTTWVPSGDGRLTTVPGTSPKQGGGSRLYRYRVQIEGGIREDGPAFADAVQRTLSDGRSWGRDFSFQRVDDTSYYDFTVVLVSPTLAEQLCRPLEINYSLSCRSGGRSVINDMRWRHGADAYGRDLADYRLYVVNHEVGHMLGHDHEQCPGAGRLAPVMMQQTKGVGACRPNPWVYPA